jgi:DNA-binding NarL/FixJ family response regulator
MTDTIQRWELLCPAAHRAEVNDWLRPLATHVVVAEVDASPRALTGTLAWMDPLTSPRVWARLRAGAAVVVVVPEPSCAFELVRRGALACVDAEAGAAWLPLALTAAPMGLHVWSPRVARRLREVFDDSADGGAYEACPTRREIETLTLFARGHSYDAAAVALGVSVNTVRSFVRTIYAKLEVASKTEAVMAARRRGWIEGG